jgi:hypothetical protein
MKFLLPLFFFLCSCVTVPVPPFGSEVGSLGKLEIQVKFHPNLINAIEKFSLNQQPKPTSSK